MSWLKKLLPQQPSPSDLPGFMADYIQYRKAGRALHTKMVESKELPLDPKAVAKRMGILNGNQLILEREDEADAMVDFGLQEIRVNGKNHFQRYADLQLPDTTPDEYVVLEARSRSVASLFQVTGTDRANYTVQAIDLLTKNTPVSFQEIGMSQTAQPGFLLFTRLLPYAHFSMTGGVSFLFRPEHKDRLLKGYGLMKFKANGNVRSDQVYLYFFRQNRAWGESIHKLDVG